MATIENYARPTWLYRYRSIGVGLGNSKQGKKKLDKEMEALLGEYIYCAPYKKMNDPMEGFCRSSKRVTEHPEYEKFSEQIRTEKLGIGISSFSETWYSELMWAHYADAFQGICICYSMSKLLSGLSEDTAFSRVAYGDKPHFLNLPSLKNDRERARAVLSTKHLSWSYEREWRLFAPQMGRQFHGKGAIKSIFLGSRVPPDVRATIEQKLKPLAARIHTTKTDGYTVIKEQARRKG